MGTRRNVMSMAASLLCHIVVFMIGGSKLAHGSDTGRSNCNSPTHGANATLNDGEHVAVSSGGKQRNADGTLSDKVSCQWEISCPRPLSTVTLTISYNTTLLWEAQADGATCIDKSAQGAAAWKNPFSVSILERATGKSVWDSRSYATRVYGPTGTTPLNTFPELTSTSVTLNASSLRLLVESDLSITGASKQWEQWAHVDVECGDAALSRTQDFVADHFEYCQLPASPFTGTQHLVTEVSSGFDSRIKLVTHHGSARSNTSWVSSTDYTPGYTIGTMETLNMLRDRFVVKNQTLSVSRFIDRSAPVGSGGNNISQPFGYFVTECRPGCQTDMSAILQRPGSFSFVPLDTPEIGLRASACSFDIYTESCSRQHGYFDSDMRTVLSSTHSGGVTQISVGTSVLEVQRDANVPPPRSLEVTLLDRTAGDSYYFRSILLNDAWSTLRQPFPNDLHKYELPQLQDSDISKNGSLTWPPKDVLSIYYQQLCRYHSPKDRQPYNLPAFPMPMRNIAVLALSCYDTNPPPPPRMNPETHDEKSNGGGGHATAVGIAIFVMVALVAGGTYLWWRRGGGKEERSRFRRLEAEHYRVEGGDEKFDSWTAMTAQAGGTMSHAKARREAYLTEEVEVDGKTGKPAWGSSPVTQELTD